MNPEGAQVPAHCWGVCWCGGWFGIGKWNWSLLVCPSTENFGYNYLVFFFWWEEVRSYRLDLIR